MISPLVKWDHSEDHFVINHEVTALRGERFHDFNLNYPEYEFIAGHKIDGEFES